MKKRKKVDDVFTFAVPNLIGTFQKRKYFNFFKVPWKLTLFSTDPMQSNSKFMLEGTLCIVGYFSPGFLEVICQNIKWVYSEDMQKCLVVAKKRHFLF